MSPHKKIASDVLELVGNTPLVRLNKVVQPGSAELLGKLESMNPAGSSSLRIWKFSSSGRTTANGRRA